ncbi:MAG: hypothetical protein C4521_10900 [Actinobacteria bacterium]|nr:MAG: hypothetical protein C4521_10900 [Actinomycetota bacterium]
MSSAPEFKPQTFDFAGQKMIATTPQQAQEYTALHRSFMEAQRTIGGLNQRMAEIEKRFAPPAPAPQGPPAEVKRQFAERLGVYDEGVYDMFDQMIEERAAAKAQEIIDQHITPMQLGLKYNAQREECERKYSDFGQYAQQIHDMIGQSGHLLSWADEKGVNALEQYYLILKGQSALQTSSTPNFAQVLQDPNARAQLFNDPNFVAAYQQYLAAQTRPAAGLPPVPIPSNPLASPVNQITNAKQAGEAFQRELLGAQ